MTISVLHFSAISESTNISPWQTRAYARVWCLLVIPWKSRASKYLKNRHEIFISTNINSREVAINSAFVCRNSIFIDHLLLRNKRVSHSWAVYCNKGSINKLEKTWDTLQALQTYAPCKLVFSYWDLIEFWIKFRCWRTLKSLCFEVVDIQYSVKFHVLEAWNFYKWKILIIINNQQSKFVIFYIFFFLVSETTILTILESSEVPLIVWISMILFGFGN